MEKEEIRIKYNSLPYEHRVITSAEMLLEDINIHLRLKDRITKLYKKEMQYINDRIKMLKKEIKGL